jgi:Predicted O-methyltransferase
MSALLRRGGGGTDRSISTHSGPKAEGTSIAQKILGAALWNSNDETNNPTRYPNLTWSRNGTLVRNLSRTTDRHDWKKANAIPWVFPARLRRGHCPAAWVQSSRHDRGWFLRLTRRAPQTPWRPAVGLRRAALASRHGAGQTHAAVSQGEAAKRANVGVSLTLAPRPIPGILQYIQIYCGWGASADGNSRLELGAGGGVVGLTVAKGCKNLKHPLYITDMVEMEPLMKYNISLNGLADRVRARILNWWVLHPLILRTPFSSPTRRPAVPQLQHSTVIGLFSPTVVLCVGLRTGGEASPIRYHSF